MFNRSRALLVAALSMGLALSPAHVTPPAAALVATVSKRRKLGLFNGLPIPSRALLVGRSSVRLSVAQAKRNAVKHRHQSRHRHHQRNVKG